jgi:hypothetical protein
MQNSDYVSREKLEQAFEQIRKDISTLHIDLAHAEGNRMRWFFIIMWLILALLIEVFFKRGIVYALGISFLLVGAFRLFDRWYIYRRAVDSEKKLGQTFEKKIDLS